MKPYNLKEIKKEKGEARVKMLIRAHLFWMRGFPLHKSGKTMWCCPLESNESRRYVVVDYKLISKARRTINELVREYPRVLPNIVGDVASWKNASLFYLEHVKTILDESCNNCTSVYDLFEKDKQYLALVKKWGGRKTETTVPIYSALSWVYCIDRAPLKNIFVWVNLYAEELVYVYEISPVTSLQLLHIFTCEPNAAGEFTDVVTNLLQADFATSNVRDYVYPLTEFKVSVKSLSKKDFKKRERPRVIANESVLNFVSWLAHARTGERKFVLNVLQLLGITDYLKRWKRWWQWVNPIVEKVVTNVTYVSDSKYETLYRLQGDLARLLNQMPQEFNIDHIFSSCRCLSASSRLRDAYLSIIKSYTLCNVTEGAGLQMFDHIHRVSHEEDNNERLLATYLLSLSKYIDKSTHESYYAPWKELNYYYSAPDYRLLSILNRHQVEYFFNILLAVNEASYRSMNRDELLSIARFVSLGVSLDKIIEFALYMSERSMFEDVEKSLIEILMALDVNAVEAGKLVSLYQRYESDLRDENLLSMCFSILCKNDGLDIFRDMIEYDLFGEMVHTCYQVNVIRKIDDEGAVPTLPQITEEVKNWIDLYPKDLHQNLKRLQSVSSSAESKAKKIVCKFWWPKELLRDEIKQLEERLKTLSGKATANLHKRIDNFKARLLSHERVSQDEVIKINQKLTHLIAVERLNRWKNTVNEVFEKCWAGYFGFMQEDMPSWLSMDKNIANLLPIVDLGRSSRKLAIKIVRERSKEAPWNFQGDAANQLFVQRMNSQGLDMGTWINGIGPKVCQLSSSKRLEIDISRDPLETINMGGHFKTCLSPGNFNFFSVFANIADINKHVIYGKNAQGKVVGRVLVGLTKQGGVKVFHRYYHDKNDKFDELVAVYIKEWVKKIGSVIVEDGDIETLVASDWYDDGAINIDSGIECFKDGSELRKKLEDLSSEDVLQVISDHLHPLEINELTFPLIVKLPELQNRSEVIVRLIDQSMKLGNLDENTLQFLFLKSVFSGCGEYFYSIHKAKLRKVVEEKLYDDYWLEKGVLINLADNDPSFVLRIFNKLKKKRYFYVNPEFKASVIRALHNLGRKKQAEKFKDLVN